MIGPVPEAPCESDDALVALLLSRAPGAWERFLARYDPLISGICRRTFLQAGAPADPQSVADASMTVVEALLSEEYRLLRAFRKGSSLEAYLRVISRSRTLDVLRRRTGSLPPWMQEVPAPVEVPLVEVEERRERLKAALATLPPREARSLRLFHVEGLSYAELALRLDMPPAQVGVFLKRSREKLRAILGDNFLEEV